MSYFIKSLEFPFNFGQKVAFFCHFSAKNEGHMSNLLTFLICENVSGTPLFLQLPPQRPPDPPPKFLPNNVLFSYYTPPFNPL